MVMGIFNSAERFQTPLVLAILPELKPSYKSKSSLGTNPEELAQF